MGIFDKFRRKHPLEIANKGLGMTEDRQNQTEGLVNMTPGEIVRKSGQYKCNVCMHGGMTDNIIKILIKEGKVYGGEGLLGTNDDVKAVERVCSREMSNYPGYDNVKHVLDQRIKSGETVTYFQKGQKFTECPTCGPVTGWTILEIANEHVREYNKL